MTGPVLGIDRGQRLQKMYLLSLLGVLAVVNFKMQYNFIINHFYVHDPYLLDSGVMTLLIHKNWSSTLPISLFGPYFMTYHVAPFLSLFSSIFYVIGSNRIVALAIFEGMTGALFVLGPFLMFYHRETLSKSEMFFATAVMVLFPLNGFIISATGYPHYELTFAALAILFICLASLKYGLLSSIAFVLALSVREDAGFHLFGLLLLILLFNRIFREKLPFQEKQLIAYAAIAFVYSVAVIIIQRKVFGGGHLFKDQFAGSPPFAHLSLDLVITRLKALNPLIFLPFLSVLSWSLIARRLSLLLGYAAFVPFFLLNFAAISPDKSSFGTYSAFPFIISLFWPLLVIARDSSLDSSESRKKYYLHVVVFIAVILSSIAGLYKSNKVAFRFVVDEMVKVKPTNYQKLDDFIAYVEKSGVLQDKRICVSQSVAALVPGSVSSATLLNAKDQGPDTALFIFHSKPSYEGFDVFRKLAAGEFNFFYDLAGTNIMLASREDLSVWPGQLSEFFTRGTTPWYKNLLKRRLGKRKVQDTEVSMESPKGFLFWGPYVHLDDGAYALQWSVRINDIKDAAKPMFRIDVCSPAGSGVLAEKDVYQKDIVNNTVVLPFSIKQTKPDELFEFRVFHYGNASAVFQDMLVKRDANDLQAH